jgi:transcriptional regulator with XRE-family HTH domain
MSIRNPTLGRRLAVARKAAGFTQVQVGEYLTVSSQWVSHLEHGHQSIDILTLQSLADLYGIDLNQCFEDPTNPDFTPTAMAITPCCTKDLHEPDLHTIRWLKRFAMNLNDLHPLLEKQPA